VTKKALCIGINDYPGTKMDLRGCVNDARDWSDTLTARGFEVSMLLDAEATKQAIVEAITALVAEAGEDDSIVITFSGHGTYVPDESGDEVDDLDEALCPYDIAQGKPLLDDEIHAIFAGRRAGTRLLLISDSCHSGTVTRDDSPPRDPEESWPRFLPLDAWMKRGALPSGGVDRGIFFDEMSNVWTSSLGDDDLLLSGCEEGRERFSYDARIDGRHNGAFTYYARKALQELPEGATYQDWHTAIRRYLPSGSHNQKPQIFGSEAARKSTIFG